MNPRKWNWIRIEAVWGFVFLLLTLEGVLEAMGMYIVDPLLSSLVYLGWLFVGMVIAIPFGIVGMRKCILMFNHRYQTSTIVAKSPLRTRSQKPQEESVEEKDAMVS